MPNTQPIEKQVEYQGHLDVHSIFDTIQGEGPFAGIPAVFIRLAGCNLQCPGCDTDYTKDRITHGIDWIVDRIRCYPNRKLVVLTGGEPLRQDVRDLCGQLLKNGYRVQIETNGTLWLPGLHQIGVNIVCSPKTPKVSDQVHKHVSAWKYILQDGKIADDGLPSSSLGCPSPPARPPKKTKLENIYVQPFDSGDEAENRTHLEAAIDTCRQHGYRLSLQLHKLCRLP